ncbi:MULTISPECIES: choline/carnitine O-acyltransferase [unclassified Sporosarcina]|uniref:choline/carnitine O-acyltransferase n=1 Tax=unclassified Sporosarcina TaxID=2647733 RepID=UPI001303F820|nr:MULTISPECIES: choline/carnitine O-acyltransferase [unclassified Sporosarcina]
MKGRIIIKKTFAYTNELPSLPIPPLTNTKEKLLEWVEPLVNDQQLEETTKAVNHFFKVDGDAERLQKKLYELDINMEGSWLKPLWDDMYLKFREPLPTGMHFNILLDNKKHENRYTRAELAGKVSRLVTEFYHLIIDGEVAPVVKNGVPQDMSQYKKFFKSIRIPKVERDEFRLAAFEKRNNHIIILYKRNMYKVNVTNSEGEIYQSREIATAIERTFQEEQSEGANVGIFTTAKRDEAAKIYDQLTVSKVNADHLQAIADSLIVLSMDEESSNSEEAIENLMLNGTNKYFDKTIQVILTNKGELGYSIEHSSVDGTTIFAVISYVNEGLESEEPETIYTAEPTLMEKQQWELSAEMVKSLMRCEKDHARVKKEFSIKTTTFNSFGSDEIKKMDISPDAFFHMALQIAQYRTFGVCSSVYEPVSVRAFYEGRTECARATSMEKLNLVKALENGEESHEVLYALMQKASAAHTDRIIRCRKGFGVERHMYGLEQMYKLHGGDIGMTDMPALFSDTGYLTMRHDFISTSGMAYDNVKYRIFGPVVEGGFGLAYILLDQTISINISSHADEADHAQKLTNHLVDAFLELRQIANRIL